MVRETSYNSPLEYISLGVAVTGLLVQSDPALSTPHTVSVQSVNVRKSVACLAGGRLMAT